MSTSNVATEPSFESPRMMAPAACMATDLTVSQPSSTSREWSIAQRLYILSMQLMTAVKWSRWLLDGLWQLFWWPMCKICGCRIWCMKDHQILLFELICQYLSWKPCKGMQTQQQYGVQLACYLISCWKLQLKPVLFENMDHLWVGDLITRDLLLQDTNKWADYWYQTWIYQECIERLEDWKEVIVSLLLASIKTRATIVVLIHVPSMSLPAQPMKHLLHVKYTMIQIRLWWCLLSTRMGDIHTWYQ